MRGAYFPVTLTQWQGEDGHLELFEGRLTEHAVPYEEAFPGVEIEAA